MVIVLALHISFTDVSISHIKSNVHFDNKNISNFNQLSGGNIIANDKITTNKLIVENTLNASNSILDVSGSLSASNINVSGGLTVSGTGSIVIFSNLPTTNLGTDGQLWNHNGTLKDI